MDKNTIVIAVLIPIISAFIGWMTNWVAIKSLFRPYKRVKFLGFSFQGLIPKRKKILVGKISEVVAEYLISHEDLMYEFKKEENVEKIKNRVIPIISERIMDAVPVMFRSVAEPMIRSVLLKESRNIILKIGDELLEHFKENMDIKSMIQSKLLDYDTRNLEDIILKVADNEFKHIEVLGAVIGFLVGLFQVFLFLIL